MTIRYTISVTVRCWLIRSVYTLPHGAIHVPSFHGSAIWTSHVCTTLPTFWLLPRCCISTCVPTFSRDLPTPARLPTALPRYRTAHLPPHVTDYLPCRLPLPAYTHRFTLPPHARLTAAPAAHMPGPAYTHHTWLRPHTHTPACGEAVLCRFIVLIVVTIYVVVVVYYIPLHSVYVVDPVPPIYLRFGDVPTISVFVTW